jgi:hypothetical protein
MEEGGKVLVGAIDHRGVITEKEPAGGSDQRDQRERIASAVVMIALCLTEV